jgi:TonB family protein
LRRAKPILVAAFLLLSGFGGAVPRERKIRQHEAPEYPSVASRLSLHGTVKLRVWVTSQGDVRKVEYIGGHPLLAESAVRAVKNWKFEAIARETTEIVTIKF